MGGPSTEDERIEQLLLPLLLLAFGAAAGATLASPPLVPPQASELAQAHELAMPQDSVAPEAPDGYLRLKVADVVLAEGAAKSAVLLTGTGERFVLPLFVTSEAGEKIQSRLDSLSFDTPSAFARAIADTGGLVVRVELQEGTDADEPFARVVISQDGAERPLDATLDEALAVALARGATIWVARGLIEQRAFETDALFPLVGNTASHLRAPALL